jgi:hypothetical protein
MRRVGGVVAFLLILGLAAAGFVNQVLLASLVPDDLVPGKSLLTLHPPKRRG